MAQREVTPEDSKKAAEYYRIVCIPAWVMKWDAVTDEVDAHFQWLDDEADRIKAFKLSLFAHGVFTLKKLEQSLFLLRMLLVCGTRGPLFKPERRYHSSHAFKRWLAQYGVVLFIWPQIVLSFPKLFYLLLGIIACIACTQ